MWISLKTLTFAGVSDHARLQYLTLVHAPMVKDILSHSCMTLCINRRLSVESQDARITVIVLCVCMCVSVTTLTATYLVYESKMRFYKVRLYYSKRMYCVDFAESALFSSFGII